MKKILLLVAVFALTLSLAGCLKEREETEAEEVVVLDVLPEGDIDITFWHIYGQGKAALLDELIAEFELLYPNINVDSVSQGSYTDLLQKTKKAIGTGVTPDLAVGYPDHFAEYLDLGGIIGLDGFVEHAEWGVDLTDFVDSYVAENEQYAEGIMYSMPYSKSTEMMVYNKTVFDANEIYLTNEDVLTWSELEVIAETVVGDGENQCEFLINYDSSANLFITASKQWDAGYTNSAGEVLIDNENTKDMLQYFDGLFDENILTLPIEWDEQYGSNNFLAEDVCMTVGSTAGITYNIPPAGSFEIGVVPIPQKEGGPVSVMQQGPNVAIMENTSDAERLASWLLIKFLTNTENTAKWAIDTGYLPVRKSGFESDNYQEHLDFEDPLFNLDYLYHSMSANAAYAQLNSFQYDPAFAGIGLISSAKVREEAGYLLETLYVETTLTFDPARVHTLDEIQSVIQDMLDQLTW